MSHRPVRTIVACLLVLSGVNFSGTKASAQMKPRVPYGWRLHGSRVDKYECGVDADTTHEGQPSAYLRGLSNTIAGDAEVVQYLSPEKFEGQHVQLSGWVKTKDVQDLAGLWMRVGDLGGEMTGFDNMENRPIKGTTDWTKYSVTLDVPTNTKDITFGFSLHGPGTVWVSGLSMEAVNTKVPTTNLAKKNRYPSDPVNLDFSANK